MSRILAVHAHPDDESLCTGITLAELAARGHDVHVLTCTLGEEGEVIPPHLEHLEGAEGDPLAAHRLTELRAALAALGVHGHLLGTDGNTRYRDSGMAGSAAARQPRAFAAAPLDQVADLMRAQIEVLAPDLVLTYDAHGGYGHPDHIRVHDATVLAVSGLPEATRPVLVATLVPRSWAEEDRRWLAAADLPGDWVVPGEHTPYPPSVVADEMVTHQVVAPARRDAQRKALRAHATQVIVEGEAFALSNLVASRLSGREGFAVLDPDTGLLAGAGEARRDLEELLSGR